MCISWIKQVAQFPAFIHEAQGIYASWQTKRWMHSCNDCYCHSHNIKCCYVCSSHSANQSDSKRTTKGKFTIVSIFKWKQASVKGFFFFLSILWFFIFNWLQWIDLLNLPIITLDVMNIIEWKICWCWWSLLPLRKSRASSYTANFRYACKILCFKYIMAYGILFFHSMVSWFCNTV